MNSPPRPEGVEAGFTHPRVNPAYSTSTITTHSKDDKIIKEAILIALRSRKTKISKSAHVQGHPDKTLKATFNDRKVMQGKILSCIHKILLSLSTNDKSYLDNDLDGFTTPFAKPIII